MALDVLRALGGVARRHTLLAYVARTELDRAVAAGDVVRLGRGVYAVPEADTALSAAVRLGGLVSHASAALRHGWAVKTVPRLPHVTVSRGRRLPRDARTMAVVHRAELPAREGWLTTKETTLEQCLRRLPFDEALSVADSALRAGLGTQLARIADTAQGPGTRQLHRVAASATPLAANPFESTLRAIALDVPGLSVRPQVTLPGLGRPDLVDERLRLILEADSFTWHGNRAALAADCRRYNRFVVEGWTVLRFSYEDVMGQPEEVRRVLRAAVALAEVLNERGPGRRAAA
jgi:very-short-patch-repair endonuclease